MTSKPNSEERQPTAIDQIAEDWITTLADLNPAVATWIGIPGRLDEYEDLSPAGHAEFIGEAKKVLARLETATEVDDVDWVTRKDLSSELQLELESDDAGLWMRDVNVIASPAQSIRDILDLMPTDSEQNWADIAGRLTNLPAAVDGYIETLRLGIKKGITPAKRQVREVVEQAIKHGAGDGFFHNFTGSASLADNAEVPASLKADLARGAEVAATAYSRSRRSSPTSCSRARAKRMASAARSTDSSRAGSSARRSTSMRRTSGASKSSRAWSPSKKRSRTRSSPARPSLEAIDVLDADPARKLHGTKALQEWMQETSDKRRRRTLGDATSTSPTRSSASSA